MKHSSLNALLYELCLSLTEVKPSLRGNVWVQKIMRHCFKDWVEWKTQGTMKDVDRQVETITKEWQAQDNQKVVEKFQEVYPEAKVTTHNVETGAVLIEHPPDGSKAQELLGGAMEIKSPWSRGKSNY